MLRITTPSSTNTYEPSHVELETVTPATNTKNDNDKVSKNNLSSSQLKQTKITAQPNTINQPNLGLNLPEAEDDPLSDLEDRITKRKKINLTIESKSDSEQKKAAQEQIASSLKEAAKQDKNAAKQDKNAKEQNNAIAIKESDKLESHTTPITTDSLKESLVNAKKLSSGHSVDKVVEGASRYVEEFKNYVNKNLDKALNIAQDKLNKETDPSKKAALKTEIRKIKEAIETAKKIDSMQGKSPEEVLAEIEKNPVLKQALEHFMQYAKDDGSGKLVLDPDKTRELNEKLFGIVFKDPEQRKFVAETLYKVDPWGAAEFFKARNARELLENINRNEKQEAKHQEELTAKKSEEAQAQRAAINNAIAAHKEELKAELKKLLDNKENKHKDILRRFGGVLGDMLSARGVELPSDSDFSGLGQTAIEALAKEGVIDRNEPEIRKLLMKFSQYKTLQDLFPKDLIQQNRKLPEPMIT